MSFGPIPERGAHARENPVCAALNRPRACSVGLPGKNRRNPPVPRAPRGRPQRFERNRVVEPSAEGGAAELIFGQHEGPPKIWWASQPEGASVGGQQQHRRVSCLEREHKEKGGSLVVGSGIVRDDGKGVDPGLVLASGQSHSRVNALEREKEAFGRKMPISVSDGVRPPSPPPGVGGEDGRHARKHVLNRENLSANEEDRKQIGTSANHFRRSALERELKANESPFGTTADAVRNVQVGHGRRNVWKTEYD